MPRPNPKVLLSRATRYLKDNPEELVRAVKGAVGLRAGIPLDAFRYLIAEFAQGKKAPQDVVVEARAPGLGLAATVNAMGTTLRASLTIFVEELSINEDEVLITARIADMELKVLDGEDTPVAGLIMSGALDLSKPGNLVAYMPKRPDVLVEAKDDRVVLDLMKVPKLASNPKVRLALGVVTPVLNVAAIRTRDDHLDVHFKATPTGLGQSLAAAGV